MKILSIDIGIRNYAYCILDSETKEIEKWEVITIDKTRIPKITCDTSLLCSELITELEKRPFLLEVDKILIERQIKAAMKMMSACTYTYFHLRAKIDKKIEIVEYDPKHKLQCWKGEHIIVGGGSKYLKNKKLAIAHCSKLCQQKEWIEIFNKSKKKDDLADSYLQGLSYILYAGKIYPQKPTAKQIKYKKFNKNNLMYLINEKNIDIDKLTDVDDEKIKKAIEMNYESVKECIEDLTSNGF